MKRKTAYFFLFSWIVINYPLTFLGYGSDMDAWRVAETAKKIWHFKHYFASRSVGFPLFELAVSPLVNIGKWYLSNLLPFIFNIIVFFALLHLAEKEKLRYPKLTLFTFMFLPVVIKNATSTMDYMPALALILWAYVLMLEHKWWLMGLFIGLSCGFRPTCAVFIIPTLIFTYIETKSFFQVFKVMIISFICGVIAYSPYLLTYGIGIPSPVLKYDHFFRILLGGYKALVLFGIVQTLALVYVLVGIVRKFVANKSSTHFFLFHFSNIIVWIILYALMPHEPEYLLPIVPSIILILDKYLSKKLFIFVIIILFSYHVVRVDSTF